MVKFARDANAPKRPMSAYFRFLSDARPQVIEQYPALRSDISAFGKYVGQLWKQCAEDDRARYQQAADADKTTYTTKMDAYRQTEGFTAYQKARKEFNKGNKVARQLKKLKKTLVNQPKRPASSYMQFAATIRPQLMQEHSDWGVADLGKAIGAEWAELSEEQKAPFQKKYEKAKVVYQRALAKYRKSKEWTNYVEAKRNVRSSVKDAERAKKLKAKEQARKLKVKEQARLAREKTLAKKAVQKAKAQTLREAAKTKRAAQKQKVLDRKEAAKAKRAAQKQKVLDRKEAKRAKKTAKKQRKQERIAAKKQKAVDKKAAQKARKLALKERAAAKKAALRVRVLAQRERTHAIALRRREAEKAKKLRQRLREKAQNQRAKVLGAKK